MLTMELHRPRRLTRPKTPAPFRVTDRDVSLLRAVARWRIATSDQLIRFAQIADPAASADRIPKRLYMLFAHGYLDRPANQHLQLSSFGNLAYGIGQKGAKLLAELGEDIDARLRWSAKNNNASIAWLPHAIGITETMLQFEIACAQRPGITLTDGAALLPSLPEITHKLRDPFRLRVTITDNFETVALSVVPDRVFSLHIGGDRRFNFCLELDRATESIVPRKLTAKSSFVRKQKGYYAAYRQDRHREQWGFAGYRVLTVTPSEKRIANMLDAQQRVTEGRVAGMFLYTTPQRMNAHGPFGPIWITSERNDLSLLEGC